MIFCASLASWSLDAPGAGLDESRKTTPLIKSLDFESGNVYWQILRENDQNFFAKGQSNGCEIQQGYLFHSVSC